MVSMLQRACVGLDQGTDPSLGNPVESQTLSMGMGLVATLLSGPQVLTTLSSTPSTWCLLNYIFFMMHVLYFL